MIENYIHYNIGRNANNTNNFELFVPSMLEWIKIAGVMLGFALLQGILTTGVESYWDSK